MNDKTNKLVLLVPGLIAAITNALWNIVTTGIFIEWSRLIKRGCLIYVGSTSFLILLYVTVLAMKWGDSLFTFTSAKNYVLLSVLATPIFVAIQLLPWTAPIYYPFGTLSTLSFDVLSGFLGVGSGLFAYSKMIEPNNMQEEKLLVAS